MALPQISNHSFHHSCNHWLVPTKSTKDTEQLLVSTRDSDIISASRVRY